MMESKKLVYRNKKMKRKQILEKKKEIYEIIKAASSPHKIIWLLSRLFTITKEMVYILPHLNHPSPFCSTLYICIRGVARTMYQSYFFLNYVWNENITDQKRIKKNIR
ncbi:hypothetical protein ACSBR1_005990 [Camellia fascicularis]